MKLMIIKTKGDTCSSEHSISTDMTKDQNIIEWFNVQL